MWQNAINLESNYAMHACEVQYLFFFRCPLSRKGVKLFDRLRTISLRHTHTHTQRRAGICYTHSCSSSEWRLSHFHSNLDYTNWDRNWKTISERDVGTIYCVVNGVETKGFLLDIFDWIFFRDIFLISQHKDTISSIYVPYLVNCKVFCIRNNTMILCNTLHKNVKSRRKSHFLSSYAKLNSRPNFWSCYKSVSWSKEEFKSFG